MAEKEMKVIGYYHSLQNINTPYSMNNLEFAIANKSKSGEIEVRSHVEDCRELLTYDFSGEWNSIRHDALRLIAFRRVKPITEISNKTFCKYMEKGLEIVRCTESYAGWPSTKIVRINVCDYPAFYIESPANWLRSPHLFSLYILLLKAGTIRNAPSQFKDLNEMIKKLESTVNNYKHKNITLNSLKIVLPKLRIIVKNTNILFKNFSRDDLWETVEWDYENSATVRGINSLCTGNLAEGQEIIYKRLKRLCKE